MKEIKALLVSSDRIITVNKNYPTRFDRSFFHTGNHNLNLFRQFFAYSQTRKWFRVNFVFFVLLIGRELNSQVQSDISKIRVTRRKVPCPLNGDCRTYIYKISVCIMDLCLINCSTPCWVNHWGKMELLPWSWTTF